MQQRTRQPRAAAHRDKPRRITAWRAGVCHDHEPGTQQPGTQQPGTLAAEARTRKLSRLVPLWPSEIEATESAAAQRVVAALERALRGERRRGRAGHWSYDVNRHVALSRALKEEQARLAALRERRPAPVHTNARGRRDSIEKKSIPIGAI